MRKKILLLEFNEICPPLIDRWLGEGKLPNFRRLRASSNVFLSIADEKDPVNLEPWIQWYSIHTGRPYSEHGVFHLTEGPKVNHPDIWGFLHSAGLSVMNCGSMNAKRLSGDRTFFLPDPWCDPGTAYPAEMVDFAKVIAKSVQEYSNSGVPLSKGEYAAFVRFLLSRGLSVNTVFAIVSQLLMERLSHNDQKWRRVALLDRLQFDVLAHYWRRMQPDFATFFSNSTAHLQHAYWRHMEPNAFAIRPSPDELATYGSAVYFGYAAMDRLIGQALDMVGDDTVVILCSGLSQQPYLKWETKGGQHFYRLHDVKTFLEKLNIHPVHVEPVMTHQYMARFRDEHDTDFASVRLRGILIDGKPLFGFTKSGDNSLVFGCEIFTVLHGKEQLSAFSGSNGIVLVEDILYPIQSTKSGCHHPDGILWVRTGDFSLHKEAVSILDIAPTICDLLEQDSTALRREGFRGTSLVERMRSGVALQRVA